MLATSTFATADLSSTHAGHVHAAGLQLPLPTVTPRSAPSPMSDDNRRHPWQYHHTSPSARSSTRTSKAEGSIDLEKGVLAMEQTNSTLGTGPVRHNKSEATPQVEQTFGSVASRRSVHPATTSNGDDSHESELEGKAIKILMFLSAPVIALSFLSCIWAIVALIVSATVQPLRVCTKRPTFAEQLRSQLGPAISLHLRCIYSAAEDPVLSSPTALLVLIVSPLLSLGVAIWSWVVAIYWIFAAMVGNPDGLDGRNDGRELVLSLRAWWQAWLNMAARD